jgi:sugar O-acyltransferase (sialic acid O-acetyltransferase NeuD family)
VRALGYGVAGFVDADPAKLGREVEPGGGRVAILQEDFLAGLEKGGALPAGADAVALAVGHNAARHWCLSRVQEVRCPPLVHPGAHLSPSAALGGGTVVFAGCVVNAAARVGRGVILNSACVVEHDCVVEDAVHVSPGAVLAGGVRVGERSWVGAGAVIIQGVRIGADVVVGAGTVVLRDVPDGVTVVGNPARVIRRR